MRGRYDWAWIGVLLIGACSSSTTSIHVTRDGGAGAAGVGGSAGSSAGHAGTTTDLDGGTDAGGQGGSAGTDAASGASGGASDGAVTDAVTETGTDAESDAGLPLGLAIGCSSGNAARDGGGCAPGTYWFDCKPSADAAAFGCTSLDFDREWCCPFPCARTPNIDFMCDVGFGATCVGGGQTTTSTGCTRLPGSDSACCVL